MTPLSTPVFLAAFPGRAGLEDVKGGSGEGVPDMLFWIGMGTLLAQGWNGLPRRAV
jgi:hypothetical protein